MGFVSKTGELEQFIAESGVPRYEVYRNSDVTKTPINLCVFANSYDDQTSISTLFAVVRQPYI